MQVVDSEFGWRGFSRPVSVAKENTVDLSTCQAPQSDHHLGGSHVPEVGHCDGLPATVSPFPVFHVESHTLWLVIVSVMDPITATFSLVQFWLPQSPYLSRFARSSLADYGGGRSRLAVCQNVPGLECVELSDRMMRRSIIRPGQADARGGERRFGPR